MLFGVHLFARYDSSHDALLVDDEGGALGAHVLTTVHALLYPDSESLVEFGVGVRNQCEG